jgi:hypothetical protein
MTIHASADLRKRKRQIKPLKPLKLLKSLKLKNFSE